MVNKVNIGFGVASLAVMVLGASLGEGQAQSPSVKMAASEQSYVRGGVAQGDTVRGVVRSYEIAAISAELNARIILLPNREGDSVRKGELIAEFDCTRLKAERDAAYAQMRNHQIAHLNLVNLLRYKAAGTVAVEQAKAEFEKSEAELRAIQARLGSCQIYAPFDGRVAEKLAHVHEISQPNQPILKLVNENRLEIVMMIPSAWLSKVVRQTEARIQMDEGNTSHRIKIIQTTGVVDPVSQSARVIGELLDQPKSVVPGMSGSVIFDRVERAQ